MSVGMNFFIIIFDIVFLNAVLVNCYQLDDLSGVGRIFDRVGGLSGGSATSKLLIGYPQQQRDEVLDYLFKSHDHSVCIRPDLPPYKVEQQTVTFELNGSFVSCSHYIGEKSFLDYPLSAEPYILAPQQGSFDVVSVGGENGQVMRQMVLQTLIAWCQETLQFNASLNLLGNFNWTDVKVQSDVQVGPINGSNGVYIGARIDNAGCGTYAAKGIFFVIVPNEKSFKVTNDIKGKKVLTQGRQVTSITSGWNTLPVKGKVAVCCCNGVLVFNITVPATPANGYVGVGTDTYGYADFDNLYIDGVITKGDTKGRALYFDSERSL